MNKPLISKKILFIILIIIIIVTLITTIAVIHNNQKTNNSKEIKYINLNEEIELQKGQTIYLNDDKKTFITYLTYVDSRCPENEECIWEGQIEYTFEYHNNQGIQEKFTLGSVRNKEYEISNYNISYVNNNDNNIIIKIKEIK